MANYLVNQDYIYLFSAILSIFTHPQNGLPSFDQYWTNTANTPATLDPNDAEVLRAAQGIDGELTTAPNPGTLSSNEPEKNSS